MRRVLAIVLACTLMMALLPNAALAHDGRHSVTDFCKKLAGAVAGVYGMLNRGAAAILRITGGTMGVSNTVDLYKEYVSHPVNATMKQQAEVLDSNAKHGIYDLRGALRP